MCNSPTANYYKPTDEPEPWDLTQLNIEASMMCLVSKVKFLCGRVGSPAVRLRSQTVKKFQPLTGGDDVEQPEPPQSSVKKVNKFTEGLDFAAMVDWGAELRPSMKKLRQAMDGLLKTARLTHSVMRVKQDAKAALRSCTAQYRRDVCFAQALTSLVTGLVARLWCSKPDPAFLLVLSTLGPLAEFEGMLSYYGIEIAMWGDMVVAIEDLCTVTFTLVHAGSGSPNDRAQGGKRPQEIMTPIPRVTGSRAALTVLLPVPEAIFSMMPSNPASRSFRVTPVFFNIGINDMASLAESLGTTKPQDKSNIDNFDRLNDYYLRYRKLGIPSLAQQADEVSARRYTTPSHQPTVGDLMDALRASVHGKQNKNVEVLHLSARICRAMRGLRFTSCKSAKDRTGMSVTLEQCSILASEYNLAEYEFQRALDCMRSEGCRRENTRKNTGIRKYAFNSLQVLGLPQPYRPPAGTYGSAQT
ncbi:hypothetical protein B566_EDAN005948 [Ephemera danica]|nr:hypothetical protein B566_EDAN005948 [Ephemera danica]